MSWRKQSTTARALLPGLTLVVALGSAAWASSLVLPGVISHVTVGVLLGIAVANLLPIPDAARPGIRFSLNRLLRVGIVLLGARISIADIVTTGLGALLVILIGMAVVLGATFVLGGLLRLPRRLAILIGVGTAVCGNSAIVATAPVIEAEERDVSFAVATITLFGTLAVVLYPLIGHAVGMSDRLFGHWAGVAVNDTSQVTATGFAFSQAAGETATIVKLTRNTLMAPLLMLIAAWYLHSGLRRDGEHVGRASRRGFLKAVPLFVLGFVAMAVLNSVGVVPSGLDQAIGQTARALILIALVGVGLSTDLSAMSRIGAAPFYLGISMAVLLAAVGWILLLVFVG